MDAVQRDDVAHAVGETFKFYGKELDGLQRKVWLRALANYEPGLIKKSLEDYTAIGKYAPKPVDITNLIGKNTASQRRDAPQRKAPPREAPEHVRKAWMYVIKLWGVGDIFHSGKISVDQAKAYIVTCNTQAKQSNNPASIPPEAWLEGIWGCTREHALRGMQ